jgi:hypothetical protein
LLVLFSYTVRAHEPHIQQSTNNSRAPQCLKSEYWHHVRLAWTREVILWLPFRQVQIMNSHAQLDTERLSIESCFRITFQVWLIKTTKKPYMYLKLKFQKSRLNKNRVGRILNVFEHI